MKCKICSEREYKNNYCYRHFLLKTAKQKLKENNVRRFNKNERKEK